MPLPLLTGPVVAFADSSNWELLLSVVIAAATGWWTIHTWRAEREKERVARQERARTEDERKAKELAAQREREQTEELRRAALYTMPFMMAAEALQSRLYNILEGQGLTPLRVTYPNGEHADEMVYLVAQYFGWERCMTHYTRYSRDKQFATNTLEIRGVFATDKHGVGLRFFHNDQISIGRLSLERYSGEYGAEFDTVGKHDFTEALQRDTTLLATAQQAVASLRKATRVDEIEERTRRRMALLQNELCELLEHLEQQQGIKVFPKARRDRAPLPGSPDVGR